MILQRMVERMQKENVYVKRKGKKIVPQCIDDLPPRLKRHTINGKQNAERAKAYNQLRYELIDKPRRAEQGRFVHNENTKGKFRTWSKQDIERLGRLTKELGYTQGVKQASKVLDRTLKSCSMAYSRYYPVQAKERVENLVNPKPAENSYTARAGRMDLTTAKKLVVNLSSTMTCTIQSDGLIVVDFK